MSKLTIRTLPLLVLFLTGWDQAGECTRSQRLFWLGQRNFDSRGHQRRLSVATNFRSFQRPQPPGLCVPAASMGGVFGVFGADFMIKPHLGINGEYSFRFAQANYLPNDGLNVRPAFYDFNAVYQPTSGDKRIVPVLEGGIGGAKLSFYITQQGGHGI